MKNKAPLAKIPALRTKGSPWAKYTPSQVWTRRTTKYRKLTKARIWDGVCQHGMNDFVRSCAARFGPLAVEIDIGDTTYYHEWRDDNEIGVFDG